MEMEMVDGSSRSNRVESNPISYNLLLDSWEDLKELKQKIEDLFYVGIGEHLWELLIPERRQQ